MRYELMVPDQIRKAIDHNWPVVLPLGVLEYHAEHLPLGVDTLVITRSLDVLEKERDMVILPVFYYGAASYAVEPPERNGSIHVDSQVLHPFARELFRNLLRIGFRNIHVFVFHQTENFTAGMPTDLAFKFAARQTIFEFLEKERGEGWWGRSDMADYYQKHAAGDNPFNWIRIHPLLDDQSQKSAPIDHAGKGETSLMMALCPEGVDMKRFSDKMWYCRDAPKASREAGKKSWDLILGCMRRALEQQSDAPERTGGENEKERALMKED